MTPKLADLRKQRAAAFDAFKALAEQPTLSDAELDHELRESRRLFEAELARPCRYLAYPWGEHDERIRAATRRAGYDAAFALRRGADGRDPYAVPRIDIYRKDHLLRAILKTSMVQPAGSGLLRLLQRSNALAWPLAAYVTLGWLMLSSTA